MLTLETLLRPFGLDTSKRIKLVRHQDSRYDIKEMHRTGAFEFYQSLQSKPVFADCDCIISFLGQPGTHAMLAGVYSVLGIEGPADFALPPGYPYPEMPTAGRYLYALERDERFQELAGRLIIDWGAGTRSWVQHYRTGDRPVIEVLPEGFVREFPGFLNVVLRHEELVKIIKHPVPQDAEVNGWRVSRPRHRHGKPVRRLGLRRGWPVGEVANLR